MSSKQDRITECEKWIIFYEDKKVDYTFDSDRKSAISQLEYWRSKLNELKKAQDDTPVALDPESFLKEMMEENKDIAHALDFDSDAQTLDFLIDTNLAVSLHLVHDGTCKIETFVDTFSNVIKFEKFIELQQLAAGIALQWQAKVEEQKPIHTCQERVDFEIDVETAAELWDYEDAPIEDTRNPDDEWRPRE